MTWSTVVKLCLIVIFCFATVDYVTAQGDKMFSFSQKYISNCKIVFKKTAARGGVGGAAAAGNLKLKDEVEFLKANLSALWDIVSALQTRAAGERQDESEELVISLGLKKRESWGPNMKNSFDSQVIT